MRPEIKENSFDKVYSNIKNFKKIKDELKSKLPYTKIQMILTKETSHEIDNFLICLTSMSMMVNQYLKEEEKFQI